MAYASKVVYTGDDVTTDYTIPFPYLSRSHINVYVNETLQLEGMSYNLSGPATVQFTSPPETDSAIVIQRNTSPSDELVDFTDGSTLRANDLDTAYLHNFYLSQEYADSWNELINQAFINVATDVGIVETETDELIAALVAEMLDDAAAATLQARVEDIDDNGEAIIQLGTDLQVQINTLASQLAADVYIQASEPVPGVGGIPDPITEGSRWYDSDDNNKPYIYQSSAWVSIEDPRIGDAVADIAVLQSETAANAAAIVAESLARTTADSAFASTLALIGAEVDGGTAFLLDLDTVKVGASETLSSRFSTITADKDANAAAITAEQVARANADSAIALDVTNLTATVGTNTAGISTNATAIAAAEGDITTLYAKYGVTLDVNGYITGFAQNNDGTTGNFVILADNFAIADPGNPDIVPFTVTSNAIRMTADVEIDGALMLNGTVVGSALVAGTIGSTQIGANAITTDKLNASAVTADKINAGAVTALKINVTDLAAISADLGSITAGDMTLDSSGFIKGGQTAYDTGSGFWLGYDSSAYKFSIGDGADQSMTWDGTTLTVKGDLVVGDYIASDNNILEADTQRSELGTTFVEKKKFIMGKDGEVRVKVDARYEATGTIEVGQFRILHEGVVKDTTSVTNSWTTYTYDLSGVSAGDEVTIELAAGWSGGLDFKEAFIRNCKIAADVAIFTGGSVDTD